MNKTIDTQTNENTTMGKPNREQRRRIRKGINKDMRNLKGAKSAWDKLVSECNGDKVLAEQVISELMKKNIDTKK